MPVRRIKQLIKRIPGATRAFHAARKVLVAHRWRGRAQGEVFEEIHAGNRWLGKESVSGTGSDSEQTRILRRELPGLLAALGIRRLLDIPCGDFRWMREVLLARPEVAYVGGDLVPMLVEENRANFGREGLEFQRIDLLHDEIPQADLLICRDCLVHLCEADARRALARIASSGNTWLLTTTFPAWHENYDIWTGEWHPLNLERAPYRLPPPEALLMEGCTEGDGRFADKALGLWKVASLPAAMIW